MGVEHYVVCRQCMEYIDLHKAYEFGIVVRSERPPVGVDCKETGFNDVVIRGGYWESRGLWFLWKHRGHEGIDLRTDSDEKWYDDEPHYKEVFSHDDDCKIRARVASQAKGQE